MPANTTPKLDSTLSKGLLVLETLVCANAGVGVTALSVELGLTKSNTYRLLQTLRTLGYVKHNADKTYSATLKTWQVGRRSIENLNLREATAAQMNQLAADTGETIYLAVRENLSVVYVNKIDSIKPIRSWNPIGGSAPIHCVGTGKAILAANYDELRDSVRHALSQHTDKTITTIDALDADMALTRKRGYAVDTGEYRERILSVGAVISLPDSEVLAALGVSLPEINLPDGDIDAIGAMVAKAAARVSASFSD
jgi:DNA-binding IclR family transcriptional regulator